MPSANARLESRYQVLIANNRIQVGRCARHRDFAHPSVDATSQVGQQVRHFKRGKLPDRAYRVFKLPEFLLEPAELSPPVGALGSTREEDVPDSRLRITGRTIRDRQNAS